MKEETGEALRRVLMMMDLNITFILSPDPLRPLPCSSAVAGCTDELSEHLRLSADPVSGSVSIQSGVHEPTLQFTAGFSISGSRLWVGSGDPMFPLLSCLPSLRGDGCPTWPPPSALSTPLAKHVNGASAEEWDATCLPTPQELCWVSAISIPPDSRHTPWGIPPPTGVSGENSERNTSGR